MNCWTTLILLWPVFCDGFEVGYTASMVNFPFVTALYYKEGQYHDKRPFCTGTIITDRYVLTTAGCMYRTNPETPSKRLYQSIQLISAWMGSSFGFVPGSQLVDAQMIYMTNYYFPLDADLKAIWGSDAPPSNNYTIGGFTYFYLDFCLIYTKTAIRYNSYVHAIPFDVRNISAVMGYWNFTIAEEDTFGTVVPDCYVAGWGGYKGEQANKLYRLRYVKARYTERIHCVIAYCGNCSLCHQRFFNESAYTCFSAYMTGDTCLEDEGAPLFCPWFGYKNQEGLGWGAMLAVLSGKMGACMKTELPSMYNVVWLAYPFFTRIMHFIWPPPGHEWIVPRSNDDDDYEQELN
uniref:Transmembrane protease serine 12 n=1 Tax=Lygus hesperus TaxID=30085 RepID=A0A0A9YN37_LYGHE